MMTGDEHERGMSMKDDDHRRLEQFQAFARGTITAHRAKEK
jgi:hypothetical protein